MRYIKYKCIMLSVIMGTVLSSCGNIGEDQQSKKILQDNSRYSEKAVYGSFENEGLTLEADIIGDVIKADQNEEAQAVFDELKRINGDDLKMVTNRYGYITFLNGKITDRPLMSKQEVTDVMKKIFPALSPNKDVELQFAFYIVDDFGNSYYLFKEQVSGDVNDSNSVKIFLDKDNYMTGLSSTIVPYADYTGEEISSTEALEIIKENVAENYPDDKMIYFADEPQIVYRRLTDSITGIEYGSKVYTIMTNNPGAGTDSTCAPFLEHMVTRQGNYVGAMPSYYSSETDETRDYDILDEWFEKSQPESYSTTVTTEIGNKYDITVPVMYHNGNYYLEDPERDIICCDFWEFEYNKNIKVVSSGDNKDWDQDYIMAYHNYIESYDFFADTGWKGPDGDGGHIILLMDYCHEDHTPIDNLCYLGQLEDVHFYTATTEAAKYHYDLDVVAHEYSHGVTNAALTNIIYDNETGAINESLSDILGQLAEIMYLEENGIEIPDEDLLIVGADSGMPVRDLLYPEAFGQPSYAGGVYYVTNVAIPSNINDYGGVHINSSLLTEIFCDMYLDQGMSNEELRSLWTTVISMMVPGTGFDELTEMVPLACSMSGLDLAIDEVRYCIEDSGIGDENPFDELEEGLCQIEFTLPPWIDWNRTRLEAYDRDGYVYVGWTEKATNRLIMTLYEGDYQLKLSEYDRDGDLIGLWEYDGSKWVTADGEIPFVSFEKDTVYELETVLIDN
ncbi:MAG: M4 family metallopeptidase [Lachnospiraceae bacterium]|nr:M4 family metallopeptidase [Lachnospiraceae bacterium]